MKLTVERILKLIYLNTDVAIIDDKDKLYWVGTKELRKCLKWEVVKIEPMGGNTIVLNVRKPIKNEKSDNKGPKRS